MGGGFNRRDPIDIKRIIKHPQVMDIFKNHKWLGLFELIKGFNKDIARQFTVALQSHSEERVNIVVIGLAITPSPELIRRITTFPLGVKWIKEDRMPSTATKKISFLLREDFIENKNGVRRESLPYP